MTFLLIASYFASAWSEDGQFLSPIDPHTSVSYEKFDYLDGPSVLRYRFVVLDSEALRQHLWRAWELEDLKMMPPIKLHLFPDFTLLAKIATVSYDGRGATLMVRPDDVDPELPGPGLIHLLLSRDGRLRASVNLRDRFFEISPADDLPYHVVVQLHPDHFPNID